VPVTEEVTIELKRQKVTAVARQHHSADRSPGSRRRRRAKSVRAERVGTGGRGQRGCSTMTPWMTMRLLT
jgi:hypothetical protein